MPVIAKRFYPVIGWILFLPLFLIIQFLLRQGLQLLSVKLIIWLWPTGGGFWEFYGKLDALWSTLSFFCIMIIGWLVWAFLRLSVIICPRPKISAWLFFSLIALVCSIGIFSLYLHAYSDNTQKAAIVISLTVNAYMGICLLLIATGGHVNKEQSLFYKGASI